LIASPKVHQEIALTSLKYNIFKFQMTIISHFAPKEFFLINASVKTFMM